MTWIRLPHSVWREGFIRQRSLVGCRRVFQPFPCTMCCKWYVLAVLYREGDHRQQQMTWHHSQPFLPFPRHMLEMLVVRLQSW
ncbi:rCG54980 [Rattus norvegicus]|uniref:RCG54980 n=1 Tax=Rattus norvegicus TaxID=10116 RepID=A6IIL8_RAT|nr:rCG54980 [Rattus norvegicus]